MIASEERLAAAPAATADDAAVGFLRRFREVTHLCSREVTHLLGNQELN
jgi:hypothetical protein